MASSTAAPGDDDVQVTRWLFQRLDCLVDGKTAKTSAADVNNFVAYAQSTVPEETKIFVFINILYECMCLWQKLATS